MKAASRFSMAALAFGTLAPALATAHDDPRDIRLYPNAAGIAATYANGPVDPDGAFFQDLGSNGRTCETCHQPAEAFSITPASIRERFQRTRGRDPLFAPVDGANCANARRADRAAHSLLLGHGLIRVAQPVPADAEFSISVVHDPYGCALSTDPDSGRLVASVYRRPLPTSNVTFLSAVMWDARETISPLGNGDSFLENLRANLMHQAASATMSHAQAASPPSDAQLGQIVDFEMSLFTAQIWDFRAGRLDARGARGGPRLLGEQMYYPGINDPLGGEPAGLPFTSFSMSMFGAWSVPASAEAAEAGRGTGAMLRDRAAARRAIAAGERLFNSAPLTITAVRGLNDNASLAKPAAITGTCTTCHDAPNVGHHSLPLPLDIGVGHTGLPGLENDPAISAALAGLDAPDLPVFEIAGCPSPFAAGQPASFFTTDPGRALISGKCGDINRFKGPVLRGLAGRAPYFHNGAAADLQQAVRFYDQRFDMKLTAEQRAQLVAFLNSL